MFLTMDDTSCEEKGGLWAKGSLSLTFSSRGWYGKYIRCQSHLDLANEIYRITFHLWVCSVVHNISSIQKCERMCTGVKGPDVTGNVFVTEAERDHFPTSQTFSTPSENQDSCIIPSVAYAPEVWAVFLVGCF